jgi:hypothetical protein
MAAIKKAPPTNSTPTTLWDVEGSFVIPGTREKVSFGPVRVGAANKTKASADLVPLLNEKFAKELAQRPRVAFEQAGFSKGFALMNLTWTTYVGKGQVKAIQAMTDQSEPPSPEA